MIRFLIYNYNIFAFAFKAVVILYTPFLLIGSSDDKIIAEIDSHSYDYLVDYDKRSYGSDISVANQAKEKTKKILQFKDYEDILDSLLSKRYKTLLSWCGIIEKDNSKLKKFYIKKSSKKDYFLKYYEKRCITPEKEFESSITSISFEYKMVYRRDRGGIKIDTLNISMVKMGIGALAKYSLIGSVHKPEFLEAELNMEDWLSFIRILYKCCVTEWKDFEKSGISAQEMPEGWKLSIHSLEKSFEYSGSSRKLPFNWERFKEALDSLDAKIRKKTGAEIMEKPWWW